MLSAHLRLSLLVVFGIYFLLMCIFLKNKMLSLKYTLLWLGAGVIMGVLVAVPDFLIYFNQLIGIQGNMNGLFVWIIIFIICILLSLTSIVSKQNDKIRQLVQVIARLEKKIRELEEEKIY